MNKLFIAGMLAVASAAVSAETAMKQGLWEMRVVKQLMDGQDMAAQRAAAMAQMRQSMASMPPAQRKQMEQMMGGQGMPGQNPDAQRICVSPEMAARDKPMSPDARCETTRFERSGNKTSFEMKCPDMSGKGESIAAGDTITTRMDMTMTDERGRHTMQSESQMKYLGPDCQGLKPADQLAKEMQGARKK